MCAMVCGKRPFLDETESSDVYKRFRYHSTGSTFRFNVERLVGLFPDLEIQFLEKALEESGNDLDLIIKRLQELQHAYADRNSESTAEGIVNVDNGDILPAGVEQVENNLPVHGSEWIELLVREIGTATSEEEARYRAANILENLEKSISSRASAEATQNYQQENVMQREQIEMLLRDNGILKRGVAIQHERQKEHEEKNREVQQLKQLYQEENREVQQLKQLVAQYQEEMRNLEMRNYALSAHLRQAQQNNSTFTSNFNPDVF